MNHSFHMHKALFAMCQASSPLGDPQLKKRSMQFKSPFLEKVAFAVQSVDNCPAEMLSDEEMDLLPSSVVFKRRQSFILRRVAARKAQILYYWSARPVLKNLACARLLIALVNCISVQALNDPQSWTTEKIRSALTNHVDNVLRPASNS